MPVAKKPVKHVEKTTGIKAPVVGVDGKAAGTMTIPEEIFGQKKHNQLIAQAIRVYLANQRVGHASTKTRGEVEGSTRKIYKQKGTGRARHGAIRAPIFVGGGITFGPEPRDYSLSFPQKMKRVALASALSEQFAAKNIVIVSGIPELSPKTKSFADMFSALGVSKRALFVVAKGSDTVVRSARNIKGVDCIPASDIHTYAVMTHPKIIVMKEAISEL